MLITEIQTKIKSPIKWVGGKYRLLEHLPIPKKISRYYEPFLGGGSMLLNIINNHPNCDCYASDTNRFLINFWNVLKNDVTGLIENIEFYSTIFNNLREETDRREYYKSLALSFTGLNKIHEDEKRYYAAKFAMVNRLSFNGLYRENKAGVFNVPYNKVKKINLDYDYLVKISDMIQQVDFSWNDFKNIHFLKDSFIYIDPPYTPASDTSSFVQYTSNSSTNEAYLRRWLRCHKNDFDILLSNNNVYPWTLPLEGYKSKVIEVQKNISAKADTRCLSEEIAIYNY
jgi:DNA adenine methylase